MNTKTSLFRGAALGALIALGVGAAAQAKPVKHHRRHHVAASAASNANAAEIEELKAQVQALTDRLNAQEAASQQAASQAAQAQQAAQAAASQAAQAQAAAEDSIKTIPTEVHTQVAALPKPDLGWAKNTQVSGRMYYDITNIDQKSDGAKASRNGTHFDIKRFYVGIDHKFNDTFSANITTDFTYDSGVGATQLYIKKAYLQAKLNPALTIRLGSADLPWIPFVEDVYGYRYVENTLIDRTGFGTSADWGVHALGSVPVGAAKVSYQLSVINGEGYKKPGINSVNRSKGIDVEGRVSAQLDHFTAAVGGYTGKRGADVQGVPTYHTANRFDALLAYTNERFRLGGEYFYTNDWSDVKNAGATNSADGFSVFGSLKFARQWGVFGRYDWVKPMRDTQPSLKDNYFNVGISYSPAKIVDFALVYKRDKVDNGFWSTSNGTIGGVAQGPGHSGTYDEVGLWSQFRW